MKFRGRFSAEQCNAATSFRWHKDRGTAFANGAHEASDSPVVYHQPGCAEHPVPQALDSAMEKPPTTLPEATPPEKGPTAGEALFAALDKDNDGTISKSELAAGIAAGLAGLVELQEQEKFSVSP